MSDLIKLSKRLQLIASFIPKGSFFADIGTDHAYLPCYVCSKDSQARAIAGEVNDGPFRRANQVVKDYNLSHVIDVRLGDGLDVLKKDPVDCIVIAGMGGTLMLSILERGTPLLKNINRLILQPNIDERSVRVWLHENNYYLTDEKIVYENGHYYEILVANKDMKNDVYDQNDLQRELLFGPFLLNERSEHFIKKWESIYNKLKRQISHMKNAKQVDQLRIAQFKEELNWIKEVLNLNDKDQ